MINLSAEAINTRAPYPVKQVDSSIFTFATKYGMTYSVGFVSDTSFLEDGVYQFFLIASAGKNSGQDNNVFETVRVIIEEFFAQKEPVMLYICDTADKRQASRDRLFRIWFNTYTLNKAYTMYNEQMTLDNIQYFSSIILRKDHPMHNHVIATFHDYIVEHDEG